MNKKLGVGIVGYGKVASRQHSRWISKRNDVFVAAVCDTADVRRDAARSDHPDAALYAEYGDMVGSDDVDLVLVTTPPNTHCALAVQAASAGKHVFVDKPFAATGEEAEEMLRAAEASGVVMHCNQSRRFDGEFRTIADTVAAGRIGDVLHIRRVWAQYGTTWTSYGVDGFNPTWRIQRAYGGGMVYDYAPHCGDQVLMLVGAPLKTVFADARALKWSEEVDDHFSCTMRFENGATAYLEASNVAPLPAPGWYVMGSKGSMTCEGVNKPVTLYTEDSEHEEVLEPVPSADRLHDNVVAACFGHAEPCVTPAQLRASTGLIDAIFASAASGASVAVR